MKRLLLLTLLFVGSINTQLFAINTGWSGGGGGEAIADRVNPWWLHNTKKVEVCIIWNKSDFQHSSGSISQLEEKLQYALNYWKQDAQKAFTVGNFTSIAQQDFHIRELITLTQLHESPPPSCLQRDLRVQFGWLSAKQIGFFENELGGLSKYIAAAIRTDYDKEEMRGKGFIYVKPNRGPLHIKNNLYVSEPWQHGKGFLIDHVLVHELGHVFGIPHKSIDTVMAIDFVERVLNPEFAEIYSNDRSQKGFFEWSRSDGTIVRDYCWRLSHSWSKAIGVEAGYQCLKVELLNKNLAFYTYEEDDPENITLRGTLQVEKDLTFGWEDTVRIFLPEEQTVFADIPQGAGPKNWLVGPMMKYIDLAGWYKSADGSTSNRMMVTLNPNGVGFSGSRFSAQVGDEFFPNLDFGTM